MQKKQIQPEKKRKEKLAKAEMPQHNFRVSRQNFKITSRSMSQQREDELKLEVKIVATYHNFIMT